MDRIEVAIITLIGPGEPIPAGHFLVKIEHAKYSRLITYTTLAEFRKLPYDIRRITLGYLIELFSDNPTIVASLQRKEYFTRDDVEYYLPSVKQPRGPLEPVNNAFHPPVAPLKPENKPANNIFHPPVAPLKPQTKPAINNNLGKKVRNRIPTDICIHWIDILNKNYNHPSAGKNKNLLLGILKARKLQWMTHHNLTIKAMKASLIDDSDKLRKAGLPRLADIAYNTSTTKDCLYNQLPWNDDYESVKHLLADNMYGAAFDSFWVDALVERQSSKDLFNTIENVGKGLILMLEKDLPSYTRSHFSRILIKEIRNNPRFWNSKAKNLYFLERASDYTAWNELLFVLNKKIENGYDAILISSLTIMIFISYRETCSSYGIKQWWLDATQANYNDVLDDYQKANGIRHIYDKFRKHVTTSGITQIHHPPTNPQSSPLNFRWALDRKPNLPGGVSRTLLEHGLPYAGGVSGSANIIAGTLVHLIKDLKVRIDAKEAILGAIMFVVYEGGHSIHEVLWTLYERELQDKYYLSLGLQLVPPGTKPLRGLFVSDYEHFIKMYHSTEAGLALSNARNDAWQKTLEYFNKYSPHKDLFTPIIAEPSPPNRLIAQGPGLRKF